MTVVALSTYEENRIFEHINSFLHHHALQVDSSPININQEKTYYRKWVKTHSFSEEKKFLTSWEKMTQVKTKSTSQAVVQYRIKLLSHCIYAKSCITSIFSALSLRTDTCGSYKHVVKYSQKQVKFFRFESIRNLQNCLEVGSIRNDFNH